MALPHDEKVSAEHWVEETGTSPPKHVTQASLDDYSSLEANLTVRDCFKYYRKAIAWSLCVSNATIMESYDILLITSFFAQPQFQRRFGEQLPNGNWSIPARWQVALSMANICGMILGVFANGYCADRWGLRKVFMTSHAFITAFIFITFFAPNLQVLTAGVALLGVPCGFFAAATPAYAAEISPVKLSGYLTVYVNLCWVMGKMIAFGVTAGTLSMTTDWAWRLPFALQWMWPVPLLIAAYFAPESPWWLARHGRLEEAKRSLERLASGPADKVDHERKLAWMLRTIETERENSQAQESYVECFKSVNRRRTEISMVAWGFQIIPGFIVQNNITYFFTLAGLKTKDAFNISVGNAGLAFTGTVLSWFVMTKFGWRTIYLTGLCCMGPVMALVGFVDLAATPSNDSTIRWVQSAMLLIWFFLYGISIGPVPYSIAATVGATNLRIKTISLGRNTYYFLSIINIIVTPYLINPAELNLKGRTAFIPTGLTVLMIIWTYFRLPELKGMSAETLNHLFMNRVSARKFVQEANKYQ